jgi:putative addiction module antidote
MNATILKIEGSEGVIIPKEVLERLGLKEGDTLEIKEDNGSITLIPEQRDQASLSEQLKAARLGMGKYKDALRELAK